MPAFSLVKNVPNQVINEGATLSYLDLKQFIQISDPSIQLRFKAECQGGKPLPAGMMCTPDGLFAGTPATGTEGSYPIVVKVEDTQGEKIDISFQVHIRPVNAPTSPEDFLREMKSKVWEAVGSNKPVPNLRDMYSTPISTLDVYHLLGRYSSFYIWNAHNLNPVGPSTALSLPGCSSHYEVLDRGSCIMAHPKDLFSHARTQLDEWVTARALAEEAFKRGWSIEFGGYDRMARIAWVHLQVLSQVAEKEVEIVNYAAPTSDGVILVKALEAVGKAPKLDLS